MRIHVVRALLLGRVQLLLLPQHEGAVRFAGAFLSLHILSLHILSLHILNLHIPALVRHFAPRFRLLLPFPSSLGVHPANPAANPAAHPAKTGANTIPLPLAFLRFMRSLLRDSPKVALKHEITEVTAARTLATLASNPDNSI